MYTFSKMDATLTGCSCRVYGEPFPALDSNYVDDTAIIFQSCANVSKGVSSIIHTGVMHPREESKTEILFCSKPESPTIIQKLLLTLTSQMSFFMSSYMLMSSYMPIFDHFKYLFSCTSRGVTDIRDVAARILKAGTTFGWTRKSLFGSQYLQR